MDAFGDPGISRDQLRWPCENQVAMRNLLYGARGHGNCFSLYGNCHLCRTLANLASLAKHAKLTIRGYDGEATFSALYTLCNFNVTEVDAE